MTSSSAADELVLQTSFRIRFCYPVQCQKPLSLTNIPSSTVPFSAPGKSDRWNHQPPTLPPAPSRDPHSPIPSHRPSLQLLCCTSHPTYHQRPCARLTTAPRFLNLSHDLMSRFQLWRARRRAIGSWGLRLKGMGILFFWWGLGMGKGVAGLGGEERGRRRGRKGGGGGGGGRRGEVR